MGHGKGEGCEHGNCSHGEHKHHGDHGHHGEGHSCGGEDAKLRERMGQVKHKIVVMSGKGGVGKSTVAVNLAVSLSLAGKKVGLLDIDIHGPSVPKMLKLEGQRVAEENGSILPIALGDLKILSIGFLLDDRDAAVIWRGPMKMSVIKQFLQDVAWGELDYLIIDSPPGTGDEPLSVCQLIPDADGAVIVTTPQDVAVADVRKSVTFCGQLNLPVLGVVENMSGFVCPKCGEVTHIFKNGGGETMAKEMGVPFLGRIPLDPRVGESCDAGTPFVHHYARTETAQAFEHVIKPLLALSANEKAEIIAAPREDGTMRIALPLANGKLCMHFGHCEVFAFFDVDTKTKTITGKSEIEPPEHQPGILPPWIAKQGATHVIAGGMGGRARELFVEQKIEVVVGAQPDSPENLVKAYLDGTLKTGDNACDH